MSRRPALAATLLALAIPAATAQLPSPCNFSLPGAAFDLGEFRGATIRGVESGGSIVHASLCGDLNKPCIDSLTKTPINGSVMLFFTEAGGRGSGASDEDASSLARHGGEGAPAPALPLAPTLAPAPAQPDGEPAPAPLACWDTIAMWRLFPPTASPLPSGAAGLRLFFSRPGDAHLDCDFVNVTIDVACNSSSPAEPSRAELTGAQDGCEWTFDVQSGAKSVCSPTRA